MALLENIKPSNKFFIGVFWTCSKVEKSIKFYIKSTRLTKNYQPSKKQSYVLCPFYNVISL